MAIRRRSPLRSLYLMSVRTISGPNGPSELNILVTVYEVVQTESYRREVLFDGRESIKTLAESGYRIP
jgi:hypothetical protein